MYSWVVARVPASMTSRSAPLRAAPPAREAAPARMYPLAEGGRTESVVLLAGRHRAEPVGPGHGQGIRRWAVPNEKMADLMNDSFALAQQHITVDQALRETTEGHVLVVLDPDASPQGILTQDMLEDMERTRYLADLLDQCAMPTLTFG